MFVKGLQTCEVWICLKEMRSSKQDREEPLLIVVTKYGRNQACSPHKTIIHDNDSLEGHKSQLQHLHIDSTVSKIPTYWKLIGDRVMVLSGSKNINPLAEASPCWNLHLAEKTQSSNYPRHDFTQQPLLNNAENGQTPIFQNLHRVIVILYLYSIFPVAGSRENHRWFHLRNCNRDEYPQLHPK